MAAKPAIVVYACPCLNIKIHLARRYLFDTHGEDRRACRVEETLSVQDPADPDEQADEKKKPEDSTEALVVKGYKFELGMGGIAVEHKHLCCTLRPSLRWTTVRCLNCETDVYGFTTESNAAPAPYYPPDTYQLSPESGKVVVLEGALWGDRLEGIRNSEEYSDAFRIVIRAQKEEKGDETIGEDTAIPELQTLQALLQQALDASLSIQHQQTESRVQQYHQQQLALLELTQQKAREDKDRLWDRIKFVAATVPPTLRSRQPPSRQWSFKSNDPGPSPILTTKASSSSLSSHGATASSPRVAGSHHHVHFEDTVVSPVVDSSSDSHPQFRRSPPPRSSVLLSPRENPVPASSSSKAPAVTPEISRASSASSFVSIGSSSSTRSRPVAPTPVIPAYVAAPPSLTTGYVPLPASVGRVGSVQPAQPVGRRPNFVMDEAEIVASYKDTGVWKMVAEGAGGERETVGAVNAKGKGKGKAVDGEVDENKMKYQSRSRELFEEEEDQMFELDEDVGEEFEEVEVEVVDDEEDAAEDDAEPHAEAEVEAEGEAEKAATQETVAEVARKAVSEVESKALTVGEEVTKEETAGNKRGKARANGLVAKEEREASGEEKRTRRVVKKRAVRKYVPEIEDEEGDEVFGQEEDDSVAMSLPAGARFTNTTATSASLTNYATSVPIAIIRHPAQRPAASNTTMTMPTTTTGSTALSSTYGRYGASVVQPSVMASVTRDGLRYDIDEDDDAAGPMIPPHVLAARTYTDETEVMFGAVPRSAKWSLSGI